MYLNIRIYKKLKSSSAPNYEDNVMCIEAMHTLLFGNSFSNRVKKSVKNGNFKRDLPGINKDFHALYSMVDEYRQLLKEAKPFYVVDLETKGEPEVEVISIEQAKLDVIKRVAEQAKTRNVPKCVIASIKKYLQKQPEAIRSQFSDSFKSNNEDAKLGKRSTAEIVDVDSEHEQI